MSAGNLKVYVVNLRRRPDRRARMEQILPRSWQAQYTSDWDGPMDGRDIDPARLPGYGLYSWQIASDNPWWDRPLKLGEVGCAVSHWLCWQRAAADGASPALILEDDAEVPADCAPRLRAALAQLASVDPGWDLLYAGRWALDGGDQPVCPGIVRPGYSYCTYGYLLSPRGLQKVLTSGFERALIPVDELLPALYLDHPRADIRALYPSRLRAYALEPALVTQLPKEAAGSDTEASGFVTDAMPRPEHAGSVR